VADYSERTIPGAEAYEYQYKKDYYDDWDIHQKYVQTFDAYEAMLIGMVYDSVSRSVDGAKITDSYAATLAIERSARVMGKLPDGETEATGKNDQGKAAFMDLLRQKWIYPNANSQHKFKIKLRNWQLYADVYGYMPMFYDWNVAASGYVGPDCWLWNPRNLVFQQGRTSIYDMEYVTALTWVGKKFLKDIIDRQPADGPESSGTESADGWDRQALQFLLECVRNERTDQDQHKDTQVSRSRTPQATKKGICLATRYEAGDEGEWVTFAPDYSCVEVRRIKNPHKNGRIPFVLKYCQPLFDSVYGLGDFQRAKPLQFARDALTNFYFKGIKMNLIPPIIANANGVLKHTVDYREGAVMLETIPNSIRRLETSTAGLATYQAAQTALTGSLLSLFGTQNAGAPGADTLNPSQGKTPAAISLYSDKEATRDGQSRESLELAIEELTDGFFSLVVNVGTESVPVSLFSADIEAIVEAGMKDVLGIFTPSSVAKFSANSTGTGGELKIDPKKLKGIEYRFNINAGSTEKINKDAQLQGLERIMTTIGKFQNIFKDDARVDVNWAQMLSTYEGLSGVKGAAKFVTVKNAPSPAEQELMDENAKLKDELGQATQAAQAASAQPAQQPKSPSESLNYKDAPEDIKRQIEEQAGLQPSAGISPAGTDQMQKHANVATALGQAMNPPEPADPGLNVAGTGHAFKDKTLSSVASQIGKQ
jgi:hypothetical protein